MLRKKKLQSVELKDLDYYNQMWLDYLRIYLMLKNAQNTNSRRISPNNNNEQLWGEVSKHDDSTFVYF